MIPYQHKGCSASVEFLPDHSQPTVALCRDCGQEWRIRVEHDRQGREIHKWVAVDTRGPSRSADPWSQGSDPW